MINDDPGRSVRRVGVMDARGGQHSGADCTGWFGHRASDGVSCQGNILTGPEVIDAIVAAMGSTADRPLHEHLMLAPEAGRPLAAKGADASPPASRFTQPRNTPCSTFGLTPTTPTTPRDLRRVHDIAVRQLQPFVTGMPTGADAIGGFSAEITDLLLRSPNER